ncbi:hypothetical protein SAMN04488033_10637 [Salegentibacter agarivorans]|uniref:Uncharacterized protein n=1 Tax=Salegentibacter agarivorans TaxID=345907 RepID=A0A1I2L338_9FLAO|nr:hypothetical protein [Salegentibacter agarivorans]SFF71546.1 hypothetical protein SAMN04488033_10637 [Salegentibacter agarivorans]
MSFDLFKYLTTLGFIYIYGRLVLHYGEVFWTYMWDEEILWKSNLEKPRILFLLTGLGVMHLISFARTTITPDNYTVQILLLLAFSSGFYLAVITWTYQFRDSIQVQKAFPALNKNKPKRENNFHLEISEDQIQKLYHGLIRYDLLNYDKTSKQDLKNVLLKNWDAHNSKIHFNMDGPSCREFHDYFIRTFPKNSLTMKNFFETSKLVLRADGKSYKYNTIIRCTPKNDLIERE